MADESTEVTRPSLETAATIPAEQGVGEPTVAAEAAAAPVAAEAPAAAESADVMPPANEVAVAPAAEPAPAQPAVAEAAASIEHAEPQPAPTRPRRRPAAATSTTAKPRTATKRAATKPATAAAPALTPTAETSVEPPAEQPSGATEPAPPRKRATTRAKGSSTTRTATVTASAKRGAPPQVLPPKARLPRAGKTVLDGLGVPVFGPRHGAVERVDWTSLADDFRRGPIISALRHRRWVYATAATDDLLVALAVVDSGATGTAFCMVTDLHTGETIADSSRPGGIKPLVSVSDEPLDGLLATYRLPGTDYHIHRAPGSTETNVRVRLRSTSQSLPGLRWLPGIASMPVLRDLPTASSHPWLDIDLTLESSVAPPMTSVSRVAADGGLVTSTMKTAAMNAWGTITVHRGDPHDRPAIYSLDGGTGGMDYTNGFLPRHTAWRWAYTTGRLSDGRLFGLNLVSDFSGIGDDAAENAVWLDGALVPLDPRVRVMHDPADLMRPWTVRTVDGSVHLQFQPLTVHREHLNLGVVRSKFVQPTGRYSGHVMVEGERVVIEGMPGVIEDQDIIW